MRAKAGGLPRSTRTPTLHLDICREIGFCIRTARRLRAGINNRTFHMRTLPLVWLCLAAVFVGLVAAVMTRPTTSDLMDHVPGALRRAVMAQSFIPENLIVAEGLTEICKVSATACFEIVKPQVRQDFTDHLIYNRYAMTGFGRTLACYGLFGQIRCGIRTP